ncbi:MAG: pyridoxal phosphate-dependent aminotransferase [Anaerolineae bacterium]|nr:pyridoxal phosphate-dependent aminotransferase [Thermoflexales bacterium]MDW8408243.1 pyridoxal phosphate-dependent aminotransferase [Anaerolineae bacterium]
MSGYLAEADLSANRIELARRRAARRGYIDLTSSNPTHQALLFPSDILREAAEQYWSRRRYDPDPRGLLPARQAIVRYYAERRAPACEHDPERVVITASTSEAYSLLFALLCAPGDNVLAPDIAYPLFEHLAAIHHVELRPYRLIEQHDWQIDPDSLWIQADRRTRAVLVVSPHNPTGMVVCERQPIFDELDLPIVCDEVFAEFTYRVARVPFLADLHPDLPVFTLNGISKMLALPDLKLGWIMLSPRAAAQYAGRLEILNDMMLGANTLTQTMLPTLLERGLPFLEHMRQRVRASLDYAIRKLSGCQRLHVTPPDGGYYLFPRVLECSDEEALVIDLLEAGVLVHPGYFYGAQVERGVGHVMISCLTRQEDLAAGIDVLCRALSNP